MDDKYGSLCERHRTMVARKSITNNFVVIIIDLQPFFLLLLLFFSARNDLALDRGVSNDIRGTVDCLTRVIIITFGALLICIRGYFVAR